MCTVSFVSSGNTNFITSNRDEHISRPVSLEPKEELINGCKITYPKDPRAGGTWFAVNARGGVAVLLNGAFEKHISTGGYAKSRGLILLEIVSNKQPIAFVQEIELENIEPFTLVLFEDKKLIEFRWDGTSKHIKELDTTQNHIWSSATLYSPDIVKHRENLFDEFLTKHKSYEPQQIIDFHTSNNDDYENGFIINRNTGLKTLSVTQAIIEKGSLVLDYFDLSNDTKHSTIISQQDRISAL